MTKRVIILLALLVGICSLLRTASASPPPTPVAIVALKGEVDDYSTGLVIRQINQARSAGAKTVILNISTNGGLVTSALDLTHFLRSQSDLHIIAYVDRAYSAGAMISLACNEIVMAPDGVIGDCAPIIFDSDDKLRPLEPTERAKESSPVLNDFDASADRGHYSRWLLESMVVVDHPVFWMQDRKTGEKRFVDQDERDKLAKTGWVPVPGVSSPVNANNSLLTVRADEAVQLGLATEQAPSVESLASQRGVLIANLTPGAGEKIIEFLNLAAVKSALMSILFVCLWIVLGSPGHGVAESILVITLALLLGVPLLTGYASWWEVLIIFGGLALLAFEVFVFPGHGVSAGLGALMVIVGLLLTFVGPQSGGGILPNNGAGWTNLRHGAIAITSASVVSIFLIIWLQKYLPSLPFFRRLVLTTTSGGDSMPNSAGVAPENSWPGVGTAGVAITDLRPGGSAAFLDLSVGDNRPIAVISETGYVAAGSKLIVRESKGNRIVVQAVAQAMTA
jgi:membrane-bound serine protease (ClpP class)